jgi:hypothetical protein
VDCDEIYLLKTMDIFNSYMPSSEIEDPQAFIQGYLRD